MTLIQSNTTATTQDLDTLVTDEHSLAVARATLSLSLLLGQLNVEKFLDDKLALLVSAKEAESRRQALISDINGNVLRLIRSGVKSHLRKYRRLDIDASPCGIAPNLDKEIADRSCFYFEAAVKERRTQDEFTLTGKLTGMLADSFDPDIPEITFKVLFYGNDVSDNDFCNDARDLYGLTIPLINNLGQEQLIQICEVLSPRLFILGVKWVTRSKSRK